MHHLESNLRGQIEFEVSKARKPAASIFKFRLTNLVNLCVPQISRLVEEVSRLQMSLQRLQESTAQSQSKLEEELEARRQHISRLEAALDRQRDYEELKREVSVLRSVDLSQIPAGESGKSLEQLLNERAKALQAAESSSLKPPSTPVDALGKYLYLCVSIMYGIYLPKSRE